MSKQRWIAIAGLAALTGAVGACQGNAAPDATDVSSVSPAPSVTASPTPSASPSPSTAQPGDTPPVLTGDRQVTIVRVDGFESGLSLTDGGRLAEVDDDSGRQLFVPTPLAGDKYLIRSYYGSGGGAGTGEAACWRVQNPGNSQPLHVQAATCDEDDARQQFEVIATPEGDDETFLISNGGAYLRTSARSGLILEELGDAPPTTSFRFHDNGPAPAQN